MVKMDDHTEHTETDSCPMCGGQPTLLGKLGQVTWLRCRHCGWEYTAAIYIEIEPEYAGEGECDE